MFSGDEYYGDEVTSPIERPQAPLYCVHYRTGGTANFKWHRTLAMTTEEVNRAYAEIKRGGRLAKIAPYGAPLPTTWEGRENA